MANQSRVLGAATCVILIASVGALGTWVRPRLFPSRLERARRAYEEARVVGCRHAGPRNLATAAGRRRGPSPACPDPWSDGARRSGPAVIPSLR